MKNAKVVTGLEVGFPDVTESGGGSAVDESGTPIFSGIVELLRAEGMEVNGDGALFEFHPWV